MKRYLILLIAFCYVFNNVCGQSTSSAIDSLVKFQIITAKERLILEKSIKNKEHDASDRALILAGLQSIILQKKFHINLHKTGVMYSYAKGYFNNKSQDSINRSLHSLLRKINTAGLLTDRVYTYAQKSIDSSQYAIDIQLIGTLAEMTSRLERLAPSKLLPVADQLHQNGIVSDSSFLRLQNDIKNNKIESAFQLNEYCRLDRVFDNKKFSDDPGFWLERFLHDISLMLPNLQFTNFNYSSEPDPATSTKDFPATKIKVSFVCNGQTYKYNRVISTYLGKRGQGHFVGMFAEVYCRLFNKVLADLQSPYRLHFSMFSHTSPEDDNTRRFALMALREEQNEVFMKDPCMSYMIVSMENYDNTLTSVRVDTTLAAWKKLGLFNHLSEEEISNATDNAKADELFSMSKLLSNFPRVVYPLDSLWTGSSLYPYQDMLKHFAGITHGVFNPTKITQQKVKGGIELQYLSNGKIHSHTFYTANGWMDAKFDPFLKQLSIENGLKGSFYKLPYNGVIYLTSQQYNYALKHKLLDLNQTTTENGKIDQKD